MKSDDRESFLEWYKTNVNSIFYFPVELLKYSRSDVDILRRCCLQFWELFMSITMTTEEDGGIDQFVTCITIASACNLVFRTNFLRPATIGIIPAQGYRPEEKHSVKALQWNKYVSQCEGVHIQHPRNGGEKIIDQYYETIATMKLKMVKRLLWNTMAVFGMDVQNGIKNTPLALSISYQWQIFIIKPWKRNYILKSKDLLTVVNGNVNLTRKFGKISISNGVLNPSILSLH